MGRGHLRQPHDADHGAAASRRRRDRARGADRPRRRALERLPRRPRRRERQDRRDSGRSARSPTASSPAARSSSRPFPPTSRPSPSRPPPSGRSPARPFGKSTAATSSPARTSTPPTSPAPACSTARSSVPPPSKPRSPRSTPPKPRRSPASKSSATATSPASSRRISRPPSAPSRRSPPTRSGPRNPASPPTRPSSSTSRRTSRPRPTSAPRRASRVTSSRASPPPTSRSPRPTPSSTSPTPRSSRAPPSPNGKDADKLTVWTGTQRPFAVREEVATALRIPTENVRVIMPDTGSAYGGKHAGDAAIEAARLSKAAGKPVRVVWTREEEFTWAYHRPAGVIEVRSGARKDGTLVAWEFHNYNSGPAGIATPYDVPNQKIQYHPVKSPLRQGSYRALAATANHFARESHMDELAHELGMDPLAFRMKNLSDPRLKAVFEAAADRFGWSKRKPQPGRGFGIAGGVEKGGYIALCAEVQSRWRAAQPPRHDPPHHRRLRVRRRHQPRRPPQPGRRRHRPGNRRSPLRSHPLRERPHHQPPLLPVPPPALPRRPPDRPRHPRPQGPPVGGCGRDADRRTRAGGGGGDLRGDGGAEAGVAAGHDVGSL